MSRTTYFDNAPTPRQLRVASIGGGPTAFIAQHHFEAIRGSGLFSIVAGAVSRDRELCVKWGMAFQVPADRLYADWHEMLAVESGRDDRPDAVLVLTETDQHADQIVSALEAGFHVVTDKPLTTTLDEALRVLKASKEANRTVMTTFNHNTYSAVQYGRTLAKTKIGVAHTALCQFLQSWGMADVENKGVKQAWRFKGQRCCGADIASHAERLIAFWLDSSYELSSVSANCRTILEGRVGDDMVAARLIYQRITDKREVHAYLMAGEMCAGHEDDLAGEVFGSSGSFAWSHLQPYQLTGSIDGKEVRLVDGRDFSTPASFNPPEHPTGFYDTWGATYRSVAGELLVSQSLIAKDKLPAELGVPTCSLNEAVESMAFVEALYQSSHAGGRAIEVSQMLPDLGS